MTDRPDPIAALRQIANGDGIYGMQAGEYKAIARAALSDPATVALHEAAGDLQGELAIVEQYLPGWREMIAELDEQQTLEATGKSMWVALNFIDFCAPRIRAVLAKSRGER